MYQEFGEYTDEVAFFVEQVTGHMIPDFRPALRHGVRALIEEIDKKLEKGGLDRKHTENLTAMKRAGAKIIITYHALDMAKWLKEEK